MKRYISLIFGGALIGALLLVAGFYGFEQLAPNTSFGSVSQSGEYFATSTDQYTQLNYPIQIKTGPGTLGSVVIVGEGLSSWEFYDATTTHQLLRTGQKPTSTILITSIPPSAAEGTYTFDIAFKDGLIWQTAGNPNVSPKTTSTITWR